jgi:hypothetical protein
MAGGTVRRVIAEIDGDANSSDVLGASHEIAKSTARVGAADSLVSRGIPMTGIVLGMEIDRGGFDRGVP